MAFLDPRQTNPRLSSLVMIGLLDLTKYLFYPWDNTVSDLMVSVSKKCHLTQHVTPISKPEILTHELHIDKTSYVHNLNFFMIHNNQDHGF